MYLLRRPILMLSSSSRVRDLITRLPVTRSVVRRFIAGETIAEVIAVVAGLRAKGLEVTLDYLGENTTSPAQASATIEGYLALIAALADADIAAGSEVSVKLSAVGQSLPDGHQRALAAARRIAGAAYAAGARMNLDIEDHTTIDSTLSILKELRQDYPDIGIALQAMLHRTGSDIAELLGPGSRVRLVKGAYDEPASVALTEPAEIDRAYVRLLSKLMQGNGYPMVGSHDPRIVAIATSLAERAGRAKDQYEHQLLYGIRPDEQQRLVAQGATVRVYVPFGTDWCGYFTRRLAERPANLLFFLRALISRD